MEAQGRETERGKAVIRRHSAHRQGGHDTLQCVDIMRVRDGKIPEHWLCMDQLSFMQELGVVSA